MTAAGMTAAIGTLPTSPSKGSSGTPTATAAKAADYSVYFTQATTVDRDAVNTVDDTTGVIGIDEAGVVGNHARFMGDFGITGPHQMIPGANR